MYTVTITCRCIHPCYPLLHTSAEIPRHAVTGCTQYLLFTLTSISPCCTSSTFYLLQRLQDWRRSGLNCSISWSNSHFTKNAVDVHLNENTPRLLEKHKEFVYFHSRGDPTNAGTCSDFNYLPVRLNEDFVLSMIWIHERHKFKNIPNTKEYFWDSYRDLAAA